MTQITGGQRLSPGLWIAAATEVAVAIAVSAIIFRVGVAPSATDHSGPDMASMESHRPMEIHWHATTLVIAGLTALMLAWWMTSRKRAAAILAAAGLVGLGMSDAVRTIALHSHVIGMAALEVLFVAVPLLLIAALPRRTSEAQPVPAVDRLGFPRGPLELDTAYRSASADGSRSRNAAGHRSGLARPARPSGRDRLLVSHSRHRRARPTRAASRGVDRRPGGRGDSRSGDPAGSRPPSRSTPGWSGHARHLRRRDAATRQTAGKTRTSNGERCPLTG